MSQAAGVWTRIVAGLHGEVPADSLEVYRLAGSTVYDLLDRVHREREEAKVGGGSPWAAARSLQFQIAFAWNAFVLQTLGDEFAGAEQAAPGFLHRVTADQAATFYQQVEPWVSRANQAASNPDYESDVHLPAELPPWVEVEPCPRAHLAAMMAALRSIRGRAVLAIGAFDEGEVPEEYRQRFGLVRQRIAAADTAAEYAVQLWTGDQSKRMHELIEQQVTSALEGYYVAGQMLALPEVVPVNGLLDWGTSAARSTHELPAPGSPGFDPWCLTAPPVRDRVSGDESARRAIDELWRRDPNPRATLDFQARIDAALAAGMIERTKQHYHRCPWASIYVVLRPLQLSTMRLRQLQQFTYDVSAEDVDEGGAFRRRLLVSTFSTVHAADEGPPTRMTQGEDRRPPAPDEPWRQPKPGQPWRPPPFDPR